MDGEFEAQGLRPKTQDTPSDPEFDRELEAALGIEPSPQFLARVRARVAAEPERSRWRLGVVEPLWGLAIAGVILAIVVPLWLRGDQPSSSSATPPAVANVRPQSPAAVGGAAATPGMAVAPTAAPRVRRTGGAVREVTATVSESAPRLSPPMFSAQERQALIALVHAVEEGRVPPLPPAPVIAQSDGVRELRIDPLVIDPLPQVARLELGASQ